MKLLVQIAKKIRPTDVELKKLKKVQEKIETRLKKTIPNDVTIATFGSVAKKTNLKDNNEIDIFLLFDKKYSYETMSKKGLECAKKAMRGIKTQISYAQHPYLKAFVEDTKIDIVPAFKMNENQKIKSAVDRSQLHTIFINNNLDKKQQDDVRLLKQFLKNIGAYGSELKTEGFSGYLCELLIVKYGSFEKTLENAANKLDISEKISEKNAKENFPNAAMVVIDPVDNTRNVAAVVSHTSLSRFIYAANDFIKKPTKDHFFKEKEIHDAKKLKKIIEKRETTNYVLIFPTPKLVDDILWPQLRRLTHNILTILKKNEFRVFGHYYYSDEKNTIILFEMYDKQLPAIKHVQGPRLQDKTHIDAFIKKHKKAINLHIEHDRIVAIEKRKYINVKKLIESQIRDKKVISVSKEFEKSLKKRTWTDAKALLKTTKMREIASDYFSRRI